MESYTQNEKNTARNTSLKHAVSILTNRRNESCCIQRDYIRNVHDYFLLQEGSTNFDEANLIDVSYISQWEDFHDSCIGKKSTRELVVCYLCGPEPQNDFEKFVSLGILPQNIWAFENNSSTYESALSSFCLGSFPQPKIVKGKIEKFFEQSPKSFDLVYIDACGSLASHQQVLKTFSILCKFNRLNSLGVVITNFAEPDICKQDEKIAYINFIAPYLYIKEHPNEEIFLKNNKISNYTYELFKEKISCDFSYYYGECISSLLRDISSVIVPIQRLKDTNFFTQYSSYIDSSSVDFNSVRNNSVGKYILFLKHIFPEVDVKTKAFLKEISVFDGNEGKLFECFEIMIKLRSNQQLPLTADINEFINKNNLHQFLDKATITLFTDLFVNQSTYPLHYVIEKSMPFYYTAKSTKMHMDIAVFDECRYIYEWLPSPMQLISAFSNKSWQYTFRFAVDGLVKSRFNYNNEFFFQGSVISTEIQGFHPKKALERKSLNDMEV